MNPSSSRGMRLVYLAEQQNRMLESAKISEQIFQDSNSLAGILGEALEAPYLILSNEDLPTTDVVGENSNQKDCDDEDNFPENGHHDNNAIEKGNNREENYFPQSGDHQEESNNAIVEENSNQEDSDDEDYFPESGDHQQEGNNAIVEENCNEEDYIDLEHNVETEGRDSVKSKKKRKRVAEPEEWQDFKNKKLREFGKEYIGWEKLKGKCGKRGKERQSRKIGPTCSSSHCQRSEVMKCNLISESDRKTIFDSFWTNLTWDQKKIYVGSLVKIGSTKRNTTHGESRRSATLIYSLKLPSREIIRVCKKMFLSTLNLGEWSVRAWVEECQIGGIVKSQSIKIKERKSLRNEKPLVNENSKKKKFLETFLDNLPKLPSHYCRKDSTKLYLEPTFRCSMAEVFHEYVCAWEKHCTDNKINPPIKALSKFCFDSIISEKNIAFQQPKKDMCDTCISFETKTISEEIYRAHIARKVKARTEKEKDKKNGEEGKCIVLTQDLQAVKVCPMLNASALYYKTKLCVHNFTVYDINSHRARCYWFDETEADLTANTFASCIIDYLSETVPTGYDSPIIIWSDGCTYQNRNAILSNALLSFSKEKNLTIVQKYLEKGHTQMEADSVHACIERKLKNQQIYLPSDYLRLSLAARKNPPYEVKKLTYAFTKDFSTSMAYTSIRPGKKAHDPTVTDLKVIKYSKGTIQVKLDFEDEFMELPTRKSMEPQNTTQFPQLHKSPLNIKAQKYLHLQQLKSVVPKDCHAFYDSLPHG